MANKKKLATAAVALGTAAALMLGGTFAWQSINQTALNEASDIVNPGGRLHDDFNGTNKDIYVENFTDPENGGEDIYARIRLEEYFEVVMNYNTAAQKTEVLVGERVEADADSVNKVMGDDGTTEYERVYKTIVLNNDETLGTVNVDENGNVKAAMDGEGTSWWNWTTGGEGSEEGVYYMPTFNLNKDSLLADINGVYADAVGGISDRDGTQQYDDTYHAYSDGETKEGYEIYDGDVNDNDEMEGQPSENLADIIENGKASAYYDEDSIVLTENKVPHTATNVGATKGLISMSEWLDMRDYDENGVLTNKADLAGYWVYDTDGWVYWSAPIPAGEATGLLLDGIELSSVMDDTWYYAINVVAQFVTADDVGKTDGTGFYDTTKGDTVPSSYAEELLTAIGVDMSGEAAGDDTTDEGGETGGVDDTTEVNPNEVLTMSVNMYENRGESLDAIPLDEWIYPGVTVTSDQDDFTYDLSYTTITFYTNEECTIEANHENIQYDSNDCSYYVHTPGTYYWKATYEYNTGANCEGMITVEGDEGGEIDTPVLAIGYSMQDADGNTLTAVSEDTYNVTASSTKDTSFKLVAGAFTVDGVEKTPELTAYHVQDTGHSDNVEVYFYSGTNKAYVFTSGYYTGDDFADDYGSNGYADAFENDALLTLDYYSGEIVVDPSITEQFSLTLSVAGHYDVGNDGGYWDTEDIGESYLTLIVNPAGSSEGEADTTAPTVEFEEYIQTNISVTISGLSDTDFPLTLSAYKQTDEAGTIAETAHSTFGITLTDGTPAFSEKSDYVNSPSYNADTGTLTFTYYAGSDGLADYDDANHKIGLKLVVADKAGNESSYTLSWTYSEGCFVAGTQVQTVNGLVNIENIQLGADVYSIDLTTGEKVVQPVTWVQENIYVTATYTIYAGGEEITATAKHPFYVVGKEWVTVENLSVGDKLMDMNGNEIEVTNIVYTELDEPVQVYNFTVDGTHNYLIAESGILVHNKP